jgi:hypothetical protein
VSVHNTACVVPASANQPEHIHAPGTLGTRLRPLTSAHGRKRAASARRLGSYSPTAQTICAKLKVDCGRWQQKSASSAQGVKPFDQTASASGTIAGCNPPTLFVPGTLQWR